MFRAVSVICLGWLLSAPSSAVAADSGFGSTLADKPAAHKKDPVATAFALPHGITLRKDQKADYDKLKKEYEPKLKELIGRAQNGENDKEKTANAKIAFKLKEEIKEKIGTILNKADPKAKKAQPKNTRAKSRPKRLVVR